MRGREGVEVRGRVALRAAYTTASGGRGKFAFSLDKALAGYM